MDPIVDTSAEPTATPPAPSTPAQATPSAPASTPTQYSYAEDRSNWVPPHRIREGTERFQQAQTQWQSREQQYQTQLDAVQRQLQALVGVQPQNPADAQAQTIKDQFYQLFPRLRELEEKGTDVLGLLDRAGDLESQTTHYWQSYGRQAVDRLYALASEGYGTPLSETQKENLHALFVGYVQSSPERTQRYASDPRIVEDFWRDFSSNFIDPARRNAQVTMAGRAAGVPLPQDTSSGVPPVAGAPKPANLDERAALAWAQYQTTKKP